MRCAPADGGVGEDFVGSGTLFLGDGKDYLKGFGSGDFKGGIGKDTLELTPGIYTIEISGLVVNFASSIGIIMKTSEFEKLIVNNTIYNFASFTNGQTISVT